MNFEGGKKQGELLSVLRNSFFSSSEDLIRIIAIELVTVFYCIISHSDDSCL